MPLLLAWRRAAYAGWLVAAPSTLLLGQLPTAPASPAQRGALSVGQQAADRLEPPAIHRWSLPVTAGEYAHVQVVQLGVDLAVRLLAPSGRLVRQVDQARGGRGTEDVRWLADSGGRWTIELSPYPRTTPGAYSVQALRRRVATADDNELLRADSLGRLAERVGGAGRYQEADSLQRHVLAIRERVLGPEHLDVALALQSIAVTSWQSRRFAEGAPLAIRALAIRERLLGPEHPDVATIANIVGLIRRGQLRYAEADSILRRVLAIRERTLPPTDPNLGAVLNNLGLVYIDQSRYADAVPMYERALSVNEVAFGPNHLEVARAALNLARAYNLLGKYADADPFYQRGASIREQALGPEHPEVAHALNMRGWNLARLARFAEAESLYKRSIAIWEKQQGADASGLAAPLQNLGVLYTNVGRLADADPLLRRALMRNEELRGAVDLEVASSANDLAVLLYRQGRYDEAIVMYRRSLGIRERILGADHRLVGQTLGNLALAHVAQKRFAEAEPLYQRALSIDEKRLGPTHPELGNALNNLGLMYSNQLRYAEAETVIRRALGIQQSALGPDHPSLRPTLRNLGVLLVNQQRYAEAEALYRQALAIEEKVGGPDLYALAMLGSLLSFTSRHADAIATLRGALAAHEQKFGVTSRVLIDILTRLGAALHEDGRHAEALPVLDRAMRMVETQAVTTATRTLYLRAGVRHANGDHAGAIADLARVIDVVEGMRPEMSRDEEVRANLFDESAKSYELMITLQVRGGNVESAIEYAERGRARVLLDQLAESGVDLRENIPLAERNALQARETAARARFVEYQQRVARLGSASDSASERARARLQDSLRIAERELITTYHDVKSASPLWRELITSDGKYTSVAAMRRLVPANGLLLLYQIGAEQSYLFLVPPRGAPSVVPLVVSADDARLFGGAAGALTSTTLRRLVAADSASPGGAPSPLIARSGRIGQPAAGVQTLESRLHALWRILVPADAWRRISAAEQVVIVPGRGLHGVPFDALVVTTSARGRGTRYWLDDGPAIRYAASATTLDALEHRASGDSSAARRRASVLSLSDPIFETTPPAVRQAGDTATRRGVPDARASDVRGGYLAAGGELSRLPGTAAETDAIRRAFGAIDPSLVQVLQREGANETSLRGAIQGKRYLHLATHGLIDEDRGALFASLALTPPPTPSAADDGFLQLHEIYQLRLVGLELAVLSACETNRGTVVGGEGVFALSRGFLAAGAKRVIASQWSVDDRSTAVLIGRLFESVATHERSGRVVDHAVALRDAKRRVRQTVGWEHPYFWAPFILMGAQ